jgi:type IV secretory pathway VirB10-like protein
MENKTENFKNMLKNPKQRNIYLSIIGLAVVTLLIGLYFATHGKGAQTIGAGANVAGVPGVAGVAGSSTNEEYNKKVRQANELGAQEALNKDKTFIPTIVAKNENNEISPLDLAEKQKQEKLLQEKKQQEEKQQAMAAEEERKLIQASKEAAIKQLEQEKQEKVEAVKKVNYETSQTRQIVTQNDYALVGVLLGNTVAKMPNSETSFGAGGSGSGGRSASGSSDVSSDSGDKTKTPKSPPFAKAGQIFNAVLETAVNSDEPSPVLAKIVSGPLAGSRLIGGLQVVGEKVLLKFDKINVPNTPSTLSISAVAVDPDSSRTAMASDVDHHYLAKYGILFGSAFLSGWGQAVQQEYMMTNISPTTGITTTQQQMPNSAIAMQALGNVGSTVGSAIGQKALAIKTTITVDSGVSMGILLLEDFSIK